MNDTSPGLSLDAANALLSDVFAPWIQALEIRVEQVDANGARLRLPYRDQLCREGAIVCGQALLSLADTAMVIAVSAASRGYRAMTTVDVSAQMMRPVQAVDVIADAKVIRLGRTLAFGDVKLYKAEGDPDAAMVASTAVTCALL